LRFDLDLPLALIALRLSCLSTPVTCPVQVMKRNHTDLKLGLNCLTGMAVCAAGLGNYVEAIDYERRRFEVARCVHTPRGECVE